MSSDRGRRSNEQEQEPPRETDRPIPPPSPMVRDNLEMEEDSDDAPDYFRHLGFPGEAPAQRIPGLGLDTAHLHLSSGREDEGRSGSPTLGRANPIPPTSTAQTPRPVRVGTLEELLPRPSRQRRRARSILFPERNIQRAPADTVPASPQAAYAANKAAEIQYEINDKRVKQPRTRRLFGLPPLVKKSEGAKGFTPHPDSFLSRKVEKVRDPFQFEDEEGVEGRGWGSGPPPPSSRNRSRVRRASSVATEAAGGEQSLEGSGDWMSMSSAEAEFWQCFQDMSSEAERWERVREQALRDSLNLGFAEQNAREMLGLRARGREQRGRPTLPAEELTVADVMRAQGLLGGASERELPGSVPGFRRQSSRRRLERSESVGAGSGSSSGNEELTEGQNRGTEDVDAFMREAARVLDEAGELEEKLGRSLHNGKSV